nr:immunoglobulin heavy chain junction region [Mus musculus]
CARHYYGSSPRYWYFDVW